MQPRFLLLVGAISVLSGCFYGDENADRWATPDQIRAAASHCGLSNFEPTRAGDAWAAWVGDGVPDRQRKEDCVYAELAGQDRLATR